MSIYTRSYLHFTPALEDVFICLSWSNKGVNINGQQLTNPRYADEIVIIARSLEALTTMLEEFDTELSKVGLRINLTKTKVNLNINTSGNRLLLVKKSKSKKLRKR